MTITELRKRIKQLIATFHIDKESEIIVTEGSRRFKIQSIQAFAHKGHPHINIEIAKMGEE